MHTRLIYSALAGIAAVLFLAVVLTGCTWGSAPAANETAPATSPEAASEPAPIPLVKFGNHPTLGEILMDDAGVTLYAFAEDRPNESTCVDVCAITWPPRLLTADYVLPEADKADFSIITRSDGDPQLAYHEMPLYYYAKDELPGDTKGQGARGTWFTVTTGLYFPQLRLLASSTPIASSTPLSSTTPATTAATATPAVSRDATVFTMDDVSMHDSAGDCWMVIDRKVYDVTRFVSTHPGGQAIVEGCGRDATTLFETRPMGSGSAHSQRARTFLPDYLIGDLL